MAKRPKTISGRISSRSTKNWRGNYSGNWSLLFRFKLPRDKFLRETVERDPDAYVDLKLILKFQRMRDILNDSGGSNNPEVVEAVAKLLKEKSVSLQVAEETSPDPRVRRKEDLRPKEEIDRDVEKRSLYANPFSDDGDD